MSPLPLVVCLAPFGDLGGLGADSFSPSLPLTWLSPSSTGLALGEWANRQGGLEG